MTSSYLKKKNKHCFYWLDPINCSGVCRKAESARRILPTFALWAKSVGSPIQWRSQWVTSPVQQSELGEGQVDLHPQPMWPTSIKAMVAAPLIQSLCPWRFGAGQDLDYARYHKLSTRRISVEFITSCTLYESHVRWSYHRQLGSQLLNWLSTLSL